MAENGAHVLVPVQSRCETAVSAEILGSRSTSEAFKSRRDDAFPMQDMVDIILDQDDEMLAPAVVVATIALLAVFVIGFLFQLIGLVF